MNLFNAYSVQILLDMLSSRLSLSLIAAHISRCRTEWS